MFKVGGDHFVRYVTYLTVAREGLSRERGCRERGAVAREGLSRERGCRERGAVVREGLSRERDCCERETGE